MCLILTIRCLSTQSNNNSINIILKHLGHIRSVGNIATNHSQLIIRKWFVGIRSSRSLGYQHIGRVACQSDDSVTVLEGLKDTFLSGEARSSKDGNVGVECCRRAHRRRFVGSDKGRCAAGKKGCCDGGELHGGNGGSNDESMARIGFVVAADCRQQALSWIFCRSSLVARSSRVQRRGSDKDARRRLLYFEFSRLTLRRSPRVKSTHNHSSISTRCITLVCY